MTAFYLAYHGLNNRSLLSSLAGIVRAAYPAGSMVRAAAGGLRVLGVCRGMQMIQHWLGVPLVPVEGHVTKALAITLDGRPAIVNSYHRWGAVTTVDALEVRGVAADGVVKAVRHRSLPIQGVMWHPERCEPFAASDLAMLREAFAMGRS